VISESLLKRTHYWLAESGERGLWPGGRPNSIHNVLRPRVDEDLEELFAALGVVRQRSVCEAKPSDVSRAAETVENTATVQGPEPEMSDQNRLDRPNCDRRVPRERFDPADVELLPLQQRRPRSLEIGLAVPDCDCQLVEVPAGRAGSDDSDRPVRKGQIPRFADETIDDVTSRTSSQEH
jgi:hypothetical protein